MKLFHFTTTHVYNREKKYEVSIKKTFGGRKFILFDNSNQNIAIYIYLYILLNCVNKSCNLI